MNYKIEFSKAAEKALFLIPKSDLKKIARKIDDLSSHPFPAGVKKLNGAEDIYRLRQGDYRILYSVFADVLLILILKIGHRREIYRD